jgi:DNA polymerase
MPQGYDDDLDRQIRSCSLCRLHETRRNAVPGTGNTNADVIFIGEGPGEQEDIQGLPFVGRAGQLLTKMLSAIGLSREEVYITNVVKCRPPGNRAPLPDEVESCFPYLQRQIRMIDPCIIMCLGGPASKTMLKTDTGIGKLRGQIYSFNDIPVIATYHPAAVLRFPERYKRDVWNDLKLLRDLYRDMRA